MMNNEKCGFSVIRFSSKQKNTENIFSINKIFKHITDTFSYIFIVNIRNCF